MNHSTDSVEILTIESRRIIRDQRLIHNNGPENLDRLKHELSVELRSFKGEICSSCWSPTTYSYRLLARVILYLFIINDSNLIKSIQNEIEDLLSESEMVKMNGIRSKWSYKELIYALITEVPLTLWNINYGRW